MKKKTKKIKTIRKIVTNFSGIKTEAFGKKTRKTIQLEVSSNEDHGAFATQSNALFRPYH